jgi:site-specific DNA-methyltransferase (adenine-specific)
VGDQTIDGSETLTSAKQKIFFREGCGWNIHDTMIYHKTGLTFPETNRYYPAFEYMIVLSKGKPKTTNLIADKPNKYGGGIIQGRSRQANGDLTRRSGHGRAIKEMGVRQNVWSYGTGWMVTSNDEEAFEHGAAFAEDMAEDHIKSWSNAGDTVLDCFMGSGTTAKAAKLLKRKSVGIEISDKYCDLMRRRLNPPMPLFDTVGAANGS